jgi:hypothetical protein
VGLKCYFCDSLGHIAINCGDFHLFQGNMMRLAIERI